MPDGVTGTATEAETRKRGDGLREPDARQADTGRRDAGQDAGQDAEERHRELVRLAYFVLPGRRKRAHRMALARRIVESTSGVGGGHARRRTRVLRRAMRPSPLWRVGLRHWLRATPSRMPPTATTNALAKLDPPVRVAYVLLNMAGMGRREARDQLLDLRIPDQAKVIEAAGRAKVPVIRTWPHSDPFAAGRIRPLGRRSPIPVGVAVAVTAVLGVALVVVEGNGRLLSGTSKAAAHGLSLVAAAPEAWRTASHSLDVWPARGDLAADKQFTGRVLDAWADAAKAGGARDQASKAGNPQLLFAGHVDGKKVALVRHGDRIGRFTGAGGPMSVSKVSTDPAAPVHVTPGRYLVAPWQRAMSITGEKLMIRQGITDPVFAATRCRRGPVMHLSSEGKARTIGEFGGPRGVPLTYRPPGYLVGKAGSKASKANVGKAKTRLRGKALRVWERTACLTPLQASPERPVSEATVWEFWSGMVSLGSGRAQWVCTGMSYADGGSAARAVLLDRHGTRGTGRCDARRPVAGSWWRSGRGDWYYLAAAARGLTPRVRGPFQSKRLWSRLLVAVPSKPGRRPTEPVTVTARRADPHAPADRPAALTARPR